MIFIIDKVTGSKDEKSFYQIIYRNMGKHEFDTYQYNDRKNEKYL